MAQLKLKAEHEGFGMVNFKLHIEQSWGAEIGILKLRR
jgi:hypothetical protein